MATTSPSGKRDSAPGAPADLFAPESRRDPHPGYHRLREQAPVAFYEDLDEWILTRWADCEAVLRDPRWSSNPSHLEARAGAADPRSFVRTVDLPILLFMDPPDHTRLRRLVSSAFTPRRVERLREHVRELVDSLLADTEPGQPFDMISTLAYPLPVIVICELMGVPVEDRRSFEGWSSDASRLLDADISEEELNKGLLAAANFIAYFGELFDRRRAEPADDLITALVQAEEAGDRLAEHELRAIVLLLFVAGHETTMNLIGNGLFALLRHRSEWERLAGDPSLAPAAVEELLRWDGPVHLTGRIATEPLEVAGRRFEHGDQVVTLLAAANRDPARFSDPDRLDITRADAGHLTFSHGAHFCLGAALARLEGQVVFEELARNHPGLELSVPESDINYRPHFVLRGLESLPVTT